MNKKNMSAWTTQCIYIKWAPYSINILVLYIGIGRFSTSLLRLYLHNNVMLNIRKKEKQVDNVFCIDSFQFMMPSEEHVIQQKNASMYLVGVGTSIIDQ